MRMRRRTLLLDQVSLLPKAPIGEDRVYGEISRSVVCAAVIFPLTSYDAMPMPEPPPAGEVYVPR
jgi:hypothetical protein